MKTITLKTEKEIELLRLALSFVMANLEALENAIDEEVTHEELDKIYIQVVE